MDYNATLGTTLQLDDATVDRVMDALDRFSVAVITQDHDPDHLAVTITVPALDLAGAVQMAQLAAQSAQLGEITSLEVLTIETFDRMHTHRPALPEMVGIMAAAQQLGASRNKVQRMIESGQLDGMKIDGPGWVVTRTSLDRAVAAAHAA